MQNSDRYRLIKSPKSGFFAHVSGYEDRETGQLVALKQIKREYLNHTDYIYRFRREIDLLEKLAPHDNIVPVLDKSPDNSDCWYVMPYAFSNLTDFMRHHNASLAFQDRLHLFDGILAAMKHAHHLKILHRDLAPTNVLIYRDLNGKYTVKVADFGLGRDTESQSGHTNTAQEGYGHSFFTAPEQLASLKSASYQSDIYSLGKILNYVFTGKLPQIYHPCAFGPVIRRATEDAPNARYSDIDAFSKAYESIKAIIGKSSILTPIERMQAYAKGSAPIDWQDFHNFAIAGEYTNHVYSDYLKPINDILENPQNMQAYHAAVGNAVEDFVRVYIECIKICTTQTRWPFSALNTFGSVLYNTYLTVSDSNIRVRCLEELWRIAYEEDQWSVQGHIRTIFARSLIPVEQEIEVVEIIRNSTARLTKDQLSKLSITSLPRIIRQALMDYSE